MDMQINFWGKIFRSSWLSKIFDYLAVIDKNGSFINAEEPEKNQTTQEGLIFLVARSIDNHDESVVPIVLETLSECVRKNLRKESFQKVIKDAYQIVSEKINNSPKIRDYGASVTAVYVKKEKAIISHIGDSRAYLLRNNIIGQITEDDTLGFELLSKGFVPNSPVNLALLDSINGNNKRSIDFIELELKKGDKIILITRQMWAITNEHYCWNEMSELVIELFNDSEFISEKKDQIIENFICDKRFYDSPILVFQLK
jgi:serine/threonine protein phosphatase PrpC